ncbi:hypothetical protein KBY74_11260 [Cyanobium sp. A1C-AMD]|uniref:hypothetical protein n=1 Tax=Cyanobium sp. A1C-AMD TaxID=2823694 RepID=UPI0020CF4EDC|nr:hypothetical protein [Cyanobium sp. A1C-AMD]MCP9880425.1 hypothetical protein [Cyanobium sp. A1C-AMD]
MFSGDQVQQVAGGGKKVPVLLIGEIKVAKAGLQLLKQGKGFGIAAQLLQYAC